MIVCQNCGNELNDDSLFCNKCGKRAKITDKSEISEIYDKNKKSKILKILASIITGIFVLVVVVGIVNSIKVKNIEDYKNKLELVVMLMINDAAEAEKMHNVYISAWRTAIKAEYGMFIRYNPDNNSFRYTSIHSPNSPSLKEKNVNRENYAKDFNEAIAIVNRIFREQGKIDSLLKGKKVIDNIMQELNDPPNDYKVVYEICFEMYGLYNQYISLAEYPSGSFVSYQEKVKELSTQLIKKHDDLNVRMPKGK